MFVDDSRVATGEHLSGKDRRLGAAKRTGVFGGPAYAGLTTNIHVLGGRPSKTCWLGPRQGQQIRGTDSANIVPFRPCLRIQHRGKGQRGLLVATKARIARTVGVGSSSTPAAAA